MQYLIRIVPIEKGWSLQWQSATMAAPSFWQYPTLKEAKRAAARFFE